MEKKMINKRIKITILLIILVSSLFSLTHYPGRLIVSHHDSARGESLTSFRNELSRFDISEKDVLSYSLNIILYSFDYARFNENYVLNAIRNHRYVFSVTFDYALESRSSFIPNDPYFPWSWHHNYMQSQAAWSLVKNNPNRNTREIVIAVPTYGIYINHEDINWWRNTTGRCLSHPGGCPGGIACDYYGWDAGHALAKTI
jgi:hypothetical protein